MLENIHKSIAKRLLVAALLLSPLFAGLVTYFEIHRVDDAVLALIHEEAMFSPTDIDRIPGHTGFASVPGFQARAEALTAKHFILVDIYDVKEEHIAAAFGDAPEDITEYFDQRHHIFPRNREIQYERHILQGSLYMQVLLPLKGSDGQLKGYFEGVYQVDEVTMRGIRGHILQGVLMAVAGIFLTSMVLYPVILFLNRQLIRFACEVFKANVELLDVMGAAIASRDSATNAHNYRVTLYALRLGERLGLSDGELKCLVAGAFLHDVGKIGVSDVILRKQSKLNSEEMEKMKQHVVIGLDIVAKAGWLDGAQEVIEYHHEKYDGSGYMQGLQGDAIPFNARLFAIVDVFDALTSERPYKREFSVDKALKILKQGRGTHFDPALLDEFVSVAENFHKQFGQASYSDLTRHLSDAIEKYFFVLKQGD